MKCFFGILLFVLFTSSYADETGGKIILIKNVLNSIITEGNDLTIEYNLYNIGDEVATDVELADSTFHDSEFKVVSGMTKVKWDKIAPGSNVTHVLVVNPLRDGAFNFTSAVVQYVATEGADPTFGFSSELGEMNIMSLKEFNRIHASHFMDWGLFALWCIPSLAFPYMFYYSSKTKYSVKSKKN